MAIRLQDKQNVQAPGSPDFPYGAIKDDTGANDGTPVNEAVYQDIHQFFARLGAQAAITYNGLREGINGVFQYYEALVTVIIDRAKSIVVNNLITNTTNVPLSAAQGVALKALIDNNLSNINTIIGTINGFVIPSISDLQSDVTDLESNKLDKAVNLGTFNLNDTSSLGEGFYYGTAASNITLRLLKNNKDYDSGDVDKGALPNYGTQSLALPCSGYQFSMICGGKSANGSQIQVLSFLDYGATAGDQPSILVKEASSLTEWKPLTVGT